ncbi:MAG: SRPBCC family protein [Deltaproteobacteria bacterium]|nr:SRPBCC family protein [Deltaproteobacteria bacterium]
MRRDRVSEIIPASCETVFDLVHDYARRLEWDTLLRAAYLDEGFSAAAKGVTSVCVGRRSLGGLALQTRYVSFERPRFAAVEMINTPPFFGRWAASIRHAALDDGTSRITYTWSFEAKPRVLRWAFEPVMARVFRWETRKRLRALRDHFAANRRN